MSEVTSQLQDLNDSDVVRIEGVLHLLQKRRERGSLELESFRQEAIDEFADIGFKVNALVYTTDQHGLYAFDFEIVERIAGEFDPDQMVWEATHDVLDLGTKGVIKTGKDLFRKFRKKWF